jgi:hypothetical protein
MRIRLLLTLLAAVGLSGAAGAQPAEPTLEVRLQSVNVLLDKAEYVAGLAGKEDVVQGVKFILKNMQAEGKGIEGVDPKRPFGLYATLSPDAISSPFTVMVPIADQDRFVTMLKEKLDITPEKVEGGALKVELPEAARNPVITTVYLRFANDYLYVGRTAKDLDPKGLIAPKVYFAKADDSVVSVIVRGDRIPAEVKTFVVGELELGVAERRKKNGPNEDPAERAVVDWLADGLTGGAKALLDDARELSVRVFVDEKGDEMTAEAVLTPRPGTPTAKYVSSLAGRTSLPAGIVAGPDAVARGSVRVSLPPEKKASFGKLIDDVSAIALKKVDEPAQDAVERVLRTLTPTAKAGELDAAAGLFGPDAKGRHTLLLAAAVKNGKEIEKLARDFAVFAGGHADITFDVEKIGDFSLHKVVLSDVPPDFDRVFGTKTLWVAVSDSHLAVSVEPEGTAIRAGLKARPAAAGVLNVEISLTKILPLAAKHLKPDEVKALLKDAFGNESPAGKDTMTVSVTGGDQLTARAKVKGKGVRLLVGADLLKQK